MLGTDFCFLRYFYDFIRVLLFQDAKNFFNICVQLNAGYGKIKKYFPETLVRDPSSKQIVHFEELEL